MTRLSAFAATTATSLRLLIMLACPSSPAPSSPAPSSPAPCLATSLLDQIAEQARRNRELRQRQAGIGDLVHRHADAVDLGLARRDPGLDRLGAGRAVTCHRRRE